jgi:hypothetical protein
MNELLATPEQANTGRADPTQANSCGNSDGGSNGGAAQSRVDSTSNPTDTPASSASPIAESVAQRPRARPRHYWLTPSVGNHINLALVFLLSRSWAHELWRRGYEHARQLDGAGYFDGLPRRAN